MRESRKKVESSPMITILNVITVLVLLAAILSIAKLVNELNHVFNRELKLSRLLYRWDLFNADDAVYLRIVNVSRYAPVEKGDISGQLIVLPIDQIRIP